MKHDIDLTPQHEAPLATAPDFVKEIFTSLAKKVEDSQPQAMHHKLTTCNSNSEKTGLSLFGQGEQPLQCYASVFEILHAKDIDHAIVVVQRDANYPLKNTLMSYHPDQGRYPIEMIADDILDFWQGEK